MKPSTSMFTRTVYIFIIGALLIACSQSRQGADSQTASHSNDSIRLGETLLRKSIRLAEQSEDWHTYYIAYQQLAVALSQGSPEEALRLMKKALTIYEQHPDDEHNYVILLDYAGTYAAQVAFNTEGSYDEAINYVKKAYGIAEKNQMNDLMCHMPARQNPYSLLRVKTEGGL